MPSFHLRAAPDYRAFSEGALLEAVLAKDELAWRELVRRYRALIYGCIRRVAHKYDAILSNEDSNEIFGDLCINLLRDDMRRLRAYDRTRGARLGSWLGMLAIHTAYDFLRCSTRRPPVEELERGAERPGELPSALDGLLEKERWSQVNRLLDDFTARDRRFVELYYVFGLNPEEIAATMGISVKTVYSKKNKVGAKLRALSSGDRLLKAA